VSEFPHVVVHAAVSLDGATDGFEPDVERYYELAREFCEDVTLTGADTILAQSRSLALGPRPGPAPDGPLLAVVDGRRRVHQWDALRDAGHWSEVIALRAAANPRRSPGERVRELTAGIWQVDLSTALGDLGSQHGAEVVRVDSGGTLTGVLLGAGLVDEVSLLVHPSLVGDRSERRWHGPAQLARRRLTLLAASALDRGLVWLRYRLSASGASGRDRGGRLDPVHAVGPR
jgi:2,5-diamino-6-(ribosylamino)-4(3H)-pyrimidinone 5'-phosphate reductase